MADHTADSIPPQTYAARKGELLKRVRRTSERILSPRAKVVMAAIVDRVNDDSPAAWPTQGTIANDVGASLRSVERAVAELRKAGCLLIDRRRQGLKSLNIYAPVLSWRPVDKSTAHTPRPATDGGPGTATDGGFGTATCGGPNSPKRTPPLELSQQQPRAGAHAHARGADPMPDRPEGAHPEAQPEAEAPKAAWQGDRGETDATANHTDSREAATRKALVSTEGAQKAAVRPLRNEAHEAQASLQRTKAALNARAGQKRMEAFDAINATLSELMRFYNGMAVMDLMVRPAAAGAGETVNDRANRLECEGRGRGVEWLKAVADNQLGDGTRTQGPAREPERVRAHATG